MVRAAFPLVAAFSCFVGCGEPGEPAGQDGAAAPSSPPSTAAPTPSDGCPYLPLKVGNRWTYRVTSPTEAPSTKTQTVARMEVVPLAGPHMGKAAYRLETRKGAGDLTVSWMVLDGARAVRLAEESYRAGTSVVNLREVWMPSRLRFDESPGRTAGGAVWRDQYTEQQAEPGKTPVATTHSETWTVETVDEPCAIAGRRLACLRVRKAGGSADAGKTYLFARCVGKVREIGRPGVGQTEELIDYAVASP